MKYYLGKYNKNGNEIIDTKDEIILKNNECLQNIDNYTSKYADECALKLALFEKGIIDLKTVKDSKYKLSVVYTYNKKNDKLPIVYSTQQKYLKTEYLYFKFLSLKQNKPFLEELVKHYDSGSSKFNNQFINVNAIYSYLNDVRRNGGNLFESSALDIAFDDIFVKATEKLNKTTGELTINYRGLRDLGMFIYRFEEKQRLIELKEQIEQEKNQYKQMLLADYINLSNESVKEEPKRYKNIADSDDYPGDLEKWNTDGYLDEEEGNYHK